MRDPRDITELTFAIVDRLMLMHDSSWSSVVLSTERRQGLFVVADAQVRLNPHLPGGYGAIGDLFAHQGRLNVDLDALIRRAQVDGSRWNGGTLAVLRPERGPILLHGYDDRPEGLPFEAAEQPAWMGAAQPDDLLFGIPFLEAVANTEAAIGRRHDAFYGALGPYRYAGYDLDARTLALETPDATFTYEAQIIGSLSTQYGSWCWSWVNRSYAELPHSFEDVSKLREPRRPGMGVLSYPGFHADPELAQRVALLAADLMGERVVFRLERPEKELVMYFALGRVIADA